MNETCYWCGSNKDLEEESIVKVCPKCLGQHTFEELIDSILELEA